MFMENWNFLIPSGRLFIDFAIIGGLFLVAMVVRRYIPFLHRYLVPVNIIAGVLGMLIGGSGLELVDLDPNRMGVYVYHLLALTFIAVSLGTGKRKLARTSTITGFILVATYVGQAIIGIALALLIKWLIMPDLFAGFGMMLPLGYGMGPGIAFSISRSWEPFGFTNGGIAGLTIANLGFVWAYIGGVILMRRGIAKGESTHFANGLTLSDALKTGYIAPEQQPEAGKQTSPVEVIEALTVHFGIIGLVYLFTIWTCTGLEKVLLSIGAEREVGTLWSFHFLLGSMVAIATRKLLNLIGLSKWLDEGLLHRTANLFVDYMLAASLIAISLQVALDYWIPLTIIGIAGGVFTVWILKILVYKLFSENRFERFLAFFANSTGTIQSGLVLLRVVDPEYKSGAADDLVYGSSVALLLGFPLLVLINIPVHNYNSSLEGYLVVLGALTVYLAALVGYAWLRLRNRNGE
jgi:ESS family glutamate:Na+ symporter